VLVLLNLFGGDAWNVGEIAVRGRGALLGPEESGLTHGTLRVLGVGSVSSRVTSHAGSVELVWWVAGAGSHQTVGVGVCSGCVVSLGWVLAVADRWWMWGRWSCPYFENCIVDASISL
jgi:hypothetical protein